MKRTIILTVILLAMVAGVLTVARLRARSRSVPAAVAPVAPTQVARTAPGDGTPPVPRQARPSYRPPQKLPVGWEDFAGLPPLEQLARVTAVMHERNLPGDVRAFFEGELLNRGHLAVTRNNLANALVWQDRPNPRLHILFIAMLDDETEDPVWRDYCLQFLSECLRSTAEPAVVKATLVRYAAGQDSLAGTAIVHLAYQEAEGRLQVDEAFSARLAAQLQSAEVPDVTKLSILGVAGKRQDRRLLPLVRQYAAQNANASLKRTAIASLGLIGDPRDEPLIRAGLAHPNRAVQLAAQAALERLGKRPAPVPRPATPK